LPGTWGCADDIKHGNKSILKLNDRNVPEAVVSIFNFDGSFVPFAVINAHISSRHIAARFSDPSVYVF
jgi:hypothetical protein